MRYGKLSKYFLISSPSFLELIVVGWKNKIEILCATPSRLNYTSICPIAWLSIPFPLSVRFSFLFVLWECCSLILCMRPLCVCVKVYISIQLECDFTKIQFILTKLRWVDTKSTAISTHEKYSVVWFAVELERVFIPNMEVEWRFCREHYVARTWTKSQQVLVG